jgi:L,D-peptidoglycan transpeptidase YkuD (ErfK/YbiS/YcfS/YnhG family)
MTARGPHRAVRLPAEQTEVIHAALTACCQVLYWAERHGTREFRAALEAATRAAAGGRTRGDLRYDLCLAIDYLDFASPATAPARRKR